MKLFISLLSLFCSYFVLAQDYPRKEIDLTRIADELYGVQDLDLNYEELYENLMQLHANPINLNKASTEDLRFIKILSESQIKKFEEYRKENKNFISIYELQAIPEFDLQTISRLAPFVTVVDPASIIDVSLWKRIQKESDNYFMMRCERTLQTRKGYTGETQPQSRFKGSPNKLYFRFRSSIPGEFSIGFTAEKDAGEKLHWSPTNRYYGVDYFSFHVQLQNKGRLKNLVLGDYQGQFGQGLMIGGIFGTGKGGETITTVRRSNIGILPYTSVYEAGYLRGIAATIEVVKHVHVTGFYSNTMRDASVSTDTLTDPFISALQKTGLHRNENELLSRKTNRDINYGAVLQYKISQIDAGVMFTQIVLALPVLPKRTVYNQFTFERRRNSNVGFFLNYTFQDLTFFSEVSRTINAGSAYTGGILWSLTPKLDLSLLYRKFDRNFYSFYSNAFSENSIAQNEAGMYWGWKFRFNQKFSTAGYVDLFLFPWLKYRSYAPSTGHEWLLRFTYQPSRKVMIFIQAREESKDRNMGDENSNLYYTGQGKKTNYWISCDYGLRQNLRMKTRAQFSTYAFNNRTTKGFALMQDVSFNAWKFKFTLRYALFDTDDYDNRQYVYENDVLLAYSMPAYDGIGVRKLAMVEYKMNRHISIWLRYASMRYPYVDKIGSGIDGIEGNIKNDVKFQVRIRL